MGPADVVDGRRRDIGLGPYPTVSLARARAIAHDNRTAVAEGRDPVAEKRQVREAARRPAPSIPTFAEAAARVIELRRPTWSNAKHAAQWESTLAAYAHPVIGGKTVDSITPADAMAVLTPIWTTKPETASRVRQRMETVMDWAVTQGYRLDNPAGRSLLKVLPPAKGPKEHRRALPYAQVPGAVARVRESTAEAPTKLAFEFLVLTAGRSAATLWMAIRDAGGTAEIVPPGVGFRDVADEAAAGAALPLLPEEWVGYARTLAEMHPNWPRAEVARISAIATAHDGGTPD